MRSIVVFVVSLSAHKGNKYPVNAKNLSAEKVMSLQKQKKSYIFRTVICLLLDRLVAFVTRNDLWHKWLSV